MADDSECCRLLEAIVGGYIDKLFSSLVGVVILIFCTAYQLFYKHKQSERILAYQTLVATVEANQNQEPAYRELAKALLKDCEADKKKLEIMKRILTGVFIILSMIALFGSIGFLSITRAK